VNKIKHNLVINALAEADLVDGEDGFAVLDNYRPKFSGETCFALVVAGIGDGFRFMVQLAYQLQTAHGDEGEFAADYLASSACMDGPVLYFPGWKLED
jgi:hypothetical protein